MWTMPMLPLVCAKEQAARQDRQQQLVQQGQKGVLHGAANAREQVKTPLPSASHGALDNGSPSPSAVE